MVWMGPLACLITVYFSMEYRETGDIHSETLQQVFFIFLVVEYQWRCSKLMPQSLADGTWSLGSTLGTLSISPTPFHSWTSHHAYTHLHVKGNYYNNTLNKYFEKSTFYNCITFTTSLLFPLKEMVFEKPIPVSNMQLSH